MKINKTLLSLVALSVIANAGFFGSNDKAYYLKHIDEAKDKMKWCEGVMIQAFKDKDEDAYKEIKKDAECNAADKALREYKRKQREIQRKKEEQARKEKEAKQKVAFEAEYKKSLEEFKKLSYMDLQKSAKEDCQYYNGSLFKSRNADLKFAKCKAYKELIGDKEKEAIKQLLQQYPNEKLMAYRDKVCKNASYDNMECDFARKVFEKQKDMIIDDYLAHKDKLKKDFNSCFYKIDALNKKSKFEEANKIRNSFKCYMPAQAAVKLNVYGYFAPIK